MVLVGIEPERAWLLSGTQFHDRLLRSPLYATGNDYPMRAAIQPDTPEALVSRFDTISAFFSVMDVHRTESTLISLLP